MSRFFVREDFADERCLYCGQRRVEDETPGGVGIDPCLERPLPNVLFACCGHGRVKASPPPYVVISDTLPPGTSCCEADESEWTHLEGEDALAYFASRGVGPPKVFA